MRRFVLALLPSLAFLPIAAVAQTAPTSPAAPAQSGQGQDDGHPHDHGEHMQKLHNMFNAANTTHDGHLTLAQAQVAGLKPVVMHFTEIDVKNRGYLTFNEIAAWRMDMMAKKLEQRAAALRAQG